MTGGKLIDDAEAWRALLDESATTITRILHDMRRIAVIGIKPSDPGGPAYTVPAYLQRVGYDIVPVPVYFPDTTEILGAPVHRTLSTIDPKADLVQLFRRPVDIAKHVDEILAARPRVVWMQLGIREEAAAETFARAGIAVIQDRCLEVELRRRAH